MSTNVFDVNASIPTLQNFSQYNSENLDTAQLSDIGVTDATINYSDPYYTLAGTVDQILSSTWTFMELASLRASSQNNYNLFNPNTITAGNLLIDASANILIRDRITASPPTGASYSLSDLWNLYYNDVLAAFGLVPYWAQLTSTQFNANYNLAIRLRVFQETVQLACPVVTIVDVITGEEQFRLSNNDDIYGYMRYAKRVTNGVPNAAYLNDLSFGEMLQIGTCITSPLLDANGKPVVYSADTSGYELTTYIDGYTSNITMQTYKRLAIDRFDDQAHSYLLGWSFLPWNDVMYNIYDVAAGQFILPSAYTLQNFTTICKLSVISMCLYELYHYARFSKFLLPHLKFTK